MQTGRRLKIRGGLFQVIDYDLNKKINFGSREEAEAYVNAGKPEVVVKKEAEPEEVDVSEHEDVTTWEADFDFSYGDNLKL